MKNYEIKYLDEYSGKNLTWNLVSIKLPKMSSKKRAKIMREIIENEKLEGLVEIWFDTSILYKPKEDLLAIFLIKKNIN